MAEKCRLLELEITDDAKGAIGDPALAAMLHEGWRIDYCWHKNVQGDSGAVRAYLMVLLTPPKHDAIISFTEIDAFSERVANVLEAMSSEQRDISKTVLNLRGQMGLLAIGLVLALVGVTMVVMS